MFRSCQAKKYGELDDLTDIEVPAWRRFGELQVRVRSPLFVQEAAVIAIPDPKWGERPLGVVVLKQGADVSPESLRAHLAQRFPKWWLPGKFVFREIPRTPTGKFLKTKLRELYGNPPG